MPHFTRRALWQAALALPAALTLFWPSAGRAEAEIDAARAEIAAFAEAAIVAIEDKSLDPSERKLALAKLFRRHFDYERISRFVLGRHWRRASEAERIAFVAAYADYLVASYAGQIRDTGGARFVLGRGRLEKDDLATVSSRVERGQGAPVEVIWRMKRGPGGWRIIDLVLEGVSLAITQRSELSAFLASDDGGVAGLTETLKAKTRSLGPAPTES